MPTHHANHEIKRRHVHLGGGRTPHARHTTKGTLTRTTPKITKLGTILTPPTNLDKPLPTKDQETKHPKPMGHNNQPLEKALERVTSPLATQPRSQPMIIRFQKTMRPFQEHRMPWAPMWNQILNNGGLCQGRFSIHWRLAFRKALPQMTHHSFIVFNNGNRKRSQAESLPRTKSSFIMVLNHF